MTDFSTLPEAPPPPRKAIPWKVVIAVVVIVIIGCLCILAAGIMIYLGMEGIGPLASLANSPIFSSSPSVIGDWDLYYDWDCTGTYQGPATISFYADQTYYAYEESGGAYGTWRVSGQEVEFLYDEYPNAHYLGAFDDTGDTAAGNMSTADGASGCWSITRRSVP